MLYSPRIMELSSAEKIEIRRWIADDPRNKDILSEMAGLWDDMDALSRLSELFPNPVTERDGSRRRRKFGIAASVAVLAAVLVSAYVADDPVRDVAEPVAIAEPAIYQTAIGVLSEFSLADGSLLTLNTNSSVEVRFDSWQRNIRMLRGELHIEVAHDADRPLNVLVGDRVFQAVGTAFTVKIYDQQRIELLVTDGVVKVGIAPALVANAEDPQSLEGSLSVFAGQRVMLDDASQQLETLEPDELEVLLSWRDGNLIFRGESLGEATVEISRYTPVEFIFLDDDLQKIRVAGLFKAGDIAGFLASLNANFDIVYQRIDDGTIQLRSSAEAAN